MQYTYVAYTVDQGIRKGRLEAKNDSDARAAIIEQGFKPLKIKRTREMPGMEKMIPSLYKVKTAQLIAFARQMSTMLASGANLLRALEMIQAQTRNKVMKKTIAKIHERVSEGESFTGALREHPLVFDQVFVSLVE